MVSHGSTFPTVALGIVSMSLAALSGCGGGGSDPPPAQPPATVITLENADAVAARGYETVDGLFQGIDAAAAQLKGADAPRSGSGVSVVRLSLTSMRWALSADHAPGTGSGPLPKAVQTVTEPCPSGGSITVVVNDADGDNAPSAGDSASLSFDRCAAAGVVVEGTLSFVVQAYVRSASSDSARATFTYGNLRATADGVTSTIDGDLTMSATISNVSPFVTDVTVSGGRMDVSEGGGTRSLTGYSGRATFDDTNRTFTYAVSGSVSGSGLPGTLTLSTPVAVSGAYDANPTAGVLVVAGAGGASVRLAAAPPTGVEVSVDTNGDGAPESTRTLTWAQLEAL
jgi:hypothetical protein